MSDEALHNLVLDYFNVESVGTRKSTSPMLTVAECRALDYAERTVRHDKVGGSYSVGIPKISDNATLPNNYVFALQMFNRQRLKFARQPALGKSFSDQMEFYCTNLARRLTPEEAEAPHPRRNLLLYHGVTHKAKQGKVRVVCNGSPVYKGKSLNGILLPGPNLLNDMPIVIIRSPQHVHSGPDVVVRVATVRTMTGIYVRPVSKLCIPLKAKRDPACLPTAVVTVPPLSLLPSHQELRSSEPQRPPLSNQQLLPLIPRETPHLFFCFLILILFIFSSENDCTYLFCFSLLFLDYSFAFVIQTKGPL
jgi:hypothetical protein